jgi:hypothetical protein
MKYSKALLEPATPLQFTTTDLVGNQKSIVYPGFSKLEAVSIEILKSLFGSMEIMPNDDLFNVWAEGSIKMAIAFINKIDEKQFEIALEINKESGSTAKIHKL